MLFVLVFILQVGFVGVLFELQILLVHGSWFKETCLMILMFLYLFFIYPLGVEPKIPRDQRLCKVGEEKKMWRSKTSKESTWFCPTKAHKTYNSYYSCYTNVREKEEGGGAPSSSLLGVFFSLWCFRMAMAVAKKEEEEKEGKKEEVRKKKKERKRKEGRKKKNKLRVLAMERAELQPPSLEAQALFETFEVQAQAEARMPKGKLRIKWVEGVQFGPPFLIFIFFQILEPKVQVWHQSKPTNIFIFIFYFFHPYEGFHPNFG